MTGGRLDIEVLICTLGEEGIKRTACMELPRAEGVSYLVSWQKSDGLTLPAELAERPDVRILRSPGAGLSRNRNFAFDNAAADILLVADDDLRYYPESLEKVRSAFEAVPGLDMALFRYESPNGFEKNYPTEPTPLRDMRCKNYYITSFEIAVRRNGRSGKLRFPEEFGIGAPKFKCGEEFVYVETARRLGHDVRFYPVTLCYHPGPTTGMRRVTDTGVYLGIGATIRLQYPLSGWLRIPLTAWRGWRKGNMKLLPATVGLLRGAILASLTFTPPWKKLTER